MPPRLVKYKQNLDERGMPMFPKEQIDVVSDFKYDSENDEYNLDYRNWRQNTQSPYVYRYTDDPHEQIFVEGKGETKLTPIAAERTVLTRVSEIVGMSLLIFLVCEMVGGLLMLWLMQSIGVDIHLDFLSFGMNGSQWSVMLTRALVAILKFGTTYLIIQGRFQLPRSVRVPSHAGGIPEVLLAVGLAMAAACVYCVVDSATGGGRILADKMYDYKNAAAVVAYALFDMFVISLMNELLFRGLMLPVLRQFGDRFAVFAIATIAFLLPNSLPERVGEFCVGLGASYLLIKGGSIIKCVVLHIIYSALTYSRLVLVYGEGATMSLPRFLIIMALTVLIGCAGYCLLRNKTRSISNKGSYLPGDMKILAFAETVSMLPWICISILLMIVEMFY